MKNHYIVHGDQKLLPSIQPLWEKLNTERAKNSPNFKKLYKAMTFSKRKKEILEKSKQGGVLVSLLYNQKGQVQAYCVSILGSGSTGEVESLFVEKPFRKKGFGALLVSEALNWMHENKSKKIIAVVGIGNEAALPFWKKMGLLPKYIQLESI